MKTIAIFNKEILEFVQELITEAFSGEPYLNTADNYRFIYADRKRDMPYEEVTDVITGSFNEKDSTLLPNLCDIYVPFTGINNLDMELITSKNISVHTTSVHSVFVAERALSLVLALQGKVVMYHQHFKNNEWFRKGSDFGDFWVSVLHKKVAIYGYGSIGQHLSSFLRPFGCPIGILNYKGRSFEGVSVFDDLESLADWCDIFVITAPLNETTEGSVDAKIFEKLISKTLVNIGRGPIINEDDLYTALTKGELYGFGSDVWYQYPSKEVPDQAPSKYDFSKFDNVIMTPHNAGAEVTSMEIRYKDVVGRIIEASNRVKES